MKILLFRLDNKSFATYGNNNACGFIFCRELGNARHSLPFHYTRAECPYELNNWNGHHIDNRLAEHYAQKKL